MTVPVLPAAKTILKAGENLGGSCCGNLGVQHDLLCYCVFSLHASAAAHNAAHRHGGDPPLPVHVGQHAVSFSAVRGDGGEVERLIRRLELFNSSRQSDSSPPPVGSRFMKCQCGTNCKHACLVGWPSAFHVSGT